MAKISISIMIFVLMLAGLLWGWRLLDYRADRAEKFRLLKLQPDAPSLFSHDLIDDLPEPARRYFTFMIAEGTPLLTVAKIEMDGKFSLGSKDAPNYMTMQASQILAPEDGFIWTASMHAGHMRFSGSDSASWTRFWGWEVVPIVRAGGNRDHEQSALGRYVAEAVFWAPAALLPVGHVQWSAPETDVARVTVQQRGMVQSADVTIAEDGRPIEVSMMRWSNANTDQVFRAQSFGGTVSDFRAVQGFQIPMHVEVGNLFGTDAYFPFFIADVTSFAFPQQDHPQ